MPTEGVSRLAERRSPAATGCNDDHRRSSDEQCARLEGWLAGARRLHTHWIETPREERLRRGVDRNGVEALDDWESWMASEDARYERDPTRERADIVLDGTHPIEQSRTDRHA